VGRWPVRSSMSTSSRMASFGPMSTPERKCIKGRSKTASRMDAKCPHGRAFAATNRMRSVLPHRRMFPRRRPLPNRACSVASIDPPAEPQLPF
jgi:hypothetical protein